MRLIDADRLLCVIDDDGGWAYDGLEYQAYMSCLRGVLEDIEEAPTIDPESLRPTAHWINEDSFYKDSIVWSCSECKGKIVLHGGTPENENYQYCPHCGARMVEPKGNEENAVSVVEKWAKDNQIKTRMTEFLKMFPDATIADDGMPDTDPCDINQKLSGWCSEDSREKCRREFWLKEIER